MSKKQQPEPAYWIVIWILRIADLVAIIVILILLLEKYIDKTNVP